MRFKVYKTVKKEVSFYINSKSMKDLRYYLKEGWKIKEVKDEK
jgi:hypothetical protein